MIEKTELRELIPHKDDMCLLDQVLDWDEDSVTCSTETHKLDTNPLRSDNQLPANALIEYGAQAMAVHGGLLARENGNQMHQGYLAALRDIKLKHQDVSLNKSPLTVIAIKQMAAQGNMIYQFEVKVGDDILASGRATVVAIFNPQQ